MRRFGPFLLVALAGCATAKPPAWLPGSATAPYVAAASGFEIALPDGWVRRNFADGDRLLATRDGTALQRVYVASSDVGKPPPLGKGARPMTDGLAPADAAAVVVEDFTAGQALTELRVVETAPATVAGRPGFRVLVAYRDEDGLKIRAAAYGVVAGPRFYTLFYVAPERHYFAADLPTFEEMVRSFRIREAAPAS